MKIKTVLASVIALASVMSASSSANATIAPVGLANQAQSASQEQFETITLGQSFNVSDAQTKSIKLDNVRYIKNLFIQAQGVYEDSQVEVFVNGELKGSIFAPGKDPSYYITVNESARSIEFRHRAGATMRIIDIKATVSARKGAVVSETENLQFKGSDKQIIKLAQEAQQLVDQLQDHCNAVDYAMYFYPIKKSAGLVSVYASAYGNLSYQTLAQMRSLADQIKFAAPHLNLMATYNEGFDMVVRLLTVQATIDDLTN